MIDWSLMSIEVLCKGCGACAAACPSKAAIQHGFTQEQIMAEIEGALWEALIGKRPAFIQEAAS